jgi:2-desacetyl-2-hydroxyethyl bacteriochlorophyllide A dehydrogenase
VPEPAAELVPGSVRVTTLYSGISAGTELTAYRGSNPYLNRTWDADRHLFVEGEATTSYPVTGWGYSEVGTVTEVAADVAGQPGVPAVGDQVWGIWGHRSSAVLPAAKLLGHTIPAGLDPLAASFARVGAVALNAVLAADVHLGELVAVFGQGVLGLLATRLATLNGAEVLACDAIPGRLEFAAEFGAKHTVDVTAASAAERARAVSGGRGADTAIEISGNTRALHEAIRSVAVGGRVVAAGFYQGEASGLRLGEEFHHNQVQLVSSQIGGVASWLSHRWDTERLQLTFMELVHRGEVAVRELVTHVMPVEAAAEAFDLLDRNQSQVLQLVFNFEE